MGLFGIDIPTKGDVLVLGQAADGTITQLQGSVLGALRNAANAVWRDDLRPTLPGLLAAELGKGDRFADGFTLYDFDVRLSADDVIQTIQRNDAGDLVVHCVTGRNTVIATSTQPTFLGSYADPRFSLDFAVAFDFIVDVPPVTAPVGGSRVLDLRFIAPHLDSQNFAGDVLLALGKIVAFLAGADVDSLLDAEIRANLGVGRINAALAPLSDVLQKYLDAGYRYLSLHAGDPDALRNQLGSVGGLDSLPAGTQSLVVLCRQPDESGVLEGEVSWPASSGRPVDDATFAFARMLASRFVPQPALGGLREAFEAGRQSWQPGQALGEELRISRVVDSFARQPSAATAAEEGLADAGVHLWDASAQQAPAEPAGRAPAAAPRLRRSLSSQAYQAVLEAFRRGPVQFTIRCVVHDPGGTHLTGHTVAMWFDDSDGWQRRRYRVEGVETGEPMTITCELAPGWHWLPGHVDQIAPRNWSGTVTVRKALPLADMIRDGDLQMTVTVRDGSRRTVSVGALESAGAVNRPGGQRSIIVVGGVPGDEAALNPQPLPPKWKDVLLRQQGDGHAVLLPGDAAGLNPQPLPPKWRELAAAQHAAGGPAARIALNPQPLPPRFAQRLRGPGTFLKRFGQHAEEQLNPPLDVPVPVGQAIEAHVDAFGDLVTQIDPDVLIPDTMNPTGYGTVRGIDFRVWLKE